MAEKDTGLPAAGNERQDAYSLVQAAKPAPAGRRRLWLACILAVMGWSSAAWCGDPATAVTLQLSWVHQGTAGGVYVADNKGLYTAEGIKIGFLEGGPKVDLIRPVVEGQAQFGVTGAAELLVARQGGNPIRAIATIFRRSPVVYVTKADSGITRPEDFIGKTIRVSTVDSVSLVAMMARLGVGRDRYRTISLPSDITRFLAGEADVWTFYVNGFVVELELAGVKLNRIYPDDYGIHFYADTLFTTDRMIATQPELVLRFLRATLKGWEIAVEDPKQIGALVRQYNTKLDAAVETLKMQATQSLVNTGEDRIGWMRADRWSRMAETLQAEGVLSGPIDVDEVFTLAFLQQIYGALR